MAASGVALALGAAVAGTAVAAGGGGGVVVSVNGVSLQSESRVPGCAITATVSGVGAGTHAVTFVAAAMEPSGTATVVNVSQTVGTGTLAVGPDDLTTLAKTLGLVSADNGYHIRVTVTVDGAQAFSMPMWLACGKSQHAGRSVRVQFAVVWRDAGGQSGSLPPAGLPSGYVLTAVSTHGTATCTYASGGAQLVCNYPPGEASDSSVPPSLQVSGLGTYTVTEQGLPAGWSPDPTTVGSFAANPTLPGAGIEHAEVVAPQAPAVATHTVVNVQAPLHAAYWLAYADGSVVPFGGAGYFGSTGGSPLNAPVVDLAPTPDKGGYWEVASDGGIFAFGDAQFYGSMGAKPLDQPVVGIAADHSGHGYWLVAQDGGIFAFGDAGFYGSMGGAPLDQPVVAMAATPDGGGYWLVAQDGGIFAFGDAPFYGSMGGQVLNQPVVDMVAAPSEGYWLVSVDGGVFAFGSAGFAGSMGAVSAASSPVVGMGGA